MGPVNYSKLLKTKSEKITVTMEFTDICVCLAKRVYAVRGPHKRKVWESLLYSIYDDLIY